MEFSIKTPDTYNGVDLTKLNDKQKLFCEEFAICRVWAIAGEKAGYNRRYSYLLKSRDDINAYIAWFIDTCRTDKVMSEQEHLEILSSIARGDIVTEVVTPAGEIVKKRPDIRDSVKSLELIGKHYGSYTEKIDVNATQVITVTFEEELSEDELAEEFGIE